MDTETPAAGPAPTSLLMWLGYRTAEDRIAAALDAAGFGAPTRERRSRRLSSPPNAMIPVPSQIQKANGLW